MHATLTFSQRVNFITSDNQTPVFLAIIPVQTTSTLIASDPMKRSAVICRSFLVSLFCFALRGHPHIMSLI